MYLPLNLCRQAKTSQFAEPHYKMFSNCYFMALLCIVISEVGGFYC